MREIRTEIEITAPRQRVWDLLADLDSYADWNPHITSASGDLREGASLDITVERIGARSRTMTVRVSDCDPPRRLQWVGTVGSKRIFRGIHTFELHEFDDDRTRFVNHEQLTGFLVPLVVSEHPQRDYDRMNEALKRRLE